MKHTYDILISKTKSTLINKLLTEQLASEDDCFGEDQTISVTAIFGNGYEMDIKCCGVQYEEGGDNTAWTEAVLFRNGSEVCCSEPSDEFLGEWILSSVEDEYVVNVKEDDYEEHDCY